MKKNEKKYLNLLYLKIKKLNQINQVKSFTESLFN
jgi:hypothetical protein